MNMTPNRIIPHILSVFSFFSRAFHSCISAQLAQARITAAVDDSSRTICAVLPILSRGRSAIAGVAPGTLPWNRHDDPVLKRSPP